MATAERHLLGCPQNGRFVDMQAITLEFTFVLVVRCLSDNRRYALYNGYSRQRAKPSPGVR